MIITHGWNNTNRMRGNLGSEQECTTDAVMVTERAFYLHSGGGGVKQGEARCHSLALVVAAW